MIDLIHQELRKSRSYVFLLSPTQSFKMCMSWMFKKIFLLNSNYPSLATSTASTIVGSFYEENHLPSLASHTADSSTRRPNKYVSKYGAASKPQGSKTEKIISKSSKSSPNLLLETGSYAGTNGTSAKWQPYTSSSSQSQYHSNGPTNYGSYSSSGYNNNNNNNNNNSSSASNGVGGYNSQGNYSSYNDSTQRYIITPKSLLYCYYNNGGTYFGEFLTLAFVLSLR